MTNERRERVDADSEGWARLDLATEGIVIVDRVGQAAHADDAMYRILGHDPLASPPDIGTLMTKIQFAGGHSFAEVLQQTFEKGSWLGEAAGLTALNHAILLQVQIRRIEDEGGQRLGAVLVARDVTRARAMVNHLLASQRLELIEKLNRGIGHEFKNLLTIIMAYGALLSKSLPTDEFQDEIRQIIDTAELSNDLINLMGVLTRPQPNRAEETDLNNVFTNVRKFLGKGLPVNISLSMPDHISLPAVYVDPVELQKALLHLGLNAAESMPKGGRVSIDAEDTEVTAEELGTIPVATAGRYAVISVSDTGTGFSEEAKQRLFEPFFTTKEQGLGLGLCSVRRAIESMDGVIRLYNEPGEGACVRIYLPIDEESVRSFTGVDGGSAAADTPAGGRILVIDDDDAARNLARALLRKSGYQVTSTSTGLEGVAAFKRKQGEIDAVLLDVVMPNLSGKETLERLRGIRPDVPVVMMSGFAPRAVREIMGEESLPCLTKPFTRDLLLRTLAKAMHREQRHD